MTKLKKKSILLALIATVAVGGFLVFASSFSPSLFPNPLEEISSNAPIAGTWTFHYLQGPPNAGAGTANLALTPSGSLAVMNIDGQTVVFHQTSSGSPAMYKSNQYTFPLPEPYVQPGTVSFTLGANTPDSIIGTTSWNNHQDMAATYTWAMELQDVDLDYFDAIINDISEGMWDITYEPVNNDCGPGGSSADFASFAGLPAGPLELDYSIDLDTGALNPNELYLNNGSDDFNLERIGETNTFGHSGPAIDLGMPINPDGDMLLDFEDQTFTGQFEFNASTENNMEGFLHVTGSGGCSASFLVDMVYTGPAPSV